MLSEESNPVLMLFACCELDKVPPNDALIFLIEFWAQPDDLLVYSSTDLPTDVGATKYC